MLPLTAPECPSENDGDRPMYSDLGLFINGDWRPARSGKTYIVSNPATEEGDPSSSTTSTSPARVGR